MSAQQSAKEDLLKKNFDILLTNNPSRFTNEKQKILLQDAFNFACNAHKNMNRYPGEPYMTHPLAVATIVFEQIGLGVKSAVAALLHDVPSKTEYGIDDIKRYFGKRTASIVAELRKIKYNEYAKKEPEKSIYKPKKQSNKKHFDDNPQASVFREILLSMSDDIRVIFIKIADRLHNMQTIEYLSNKNKEKLVKEILTIYAPLAHRLGLYKIKAELEDLCLKHSNPERYNEINNKIKSTKKDRIEFVGRFTQPIKSKLDKAGIEYRVESRVKSIYSIWKKMQKKKVSFEEVYDLFAFRIIFSPKNEINEINEINDIGKIITQLYTEKLDRRREWLETPKDTGYQALHLTVSNEENRWVEVQIRSKKMHDIAEYGLAAHWKYKGLRGVKTEFDVKVREILEHLSKNNSSADDFLDNLKLNLLSSKIRVLTPKGHIVTLPKGASVLDFAFKIHTDLAYKCIASKINGITSSIYKKIKNGDKIEIITSQKNKPKKEWFNHVITQKALNSLRNIFKHEIKSSYEKGEKIITNIIETLNIPDTKSAKKQLIDEMSNILSKKDFFISVGEKKISEIDMVEIIKKCCTQRKSKFWKIKIPFQKQQLKNPEPKGNSRLKINYTIANCCTPLPGDNVIGIKNFDSNKIEIHKTDCSVAIVHRDCFDVEWTSYTAISILSKFRIQGKNSKGIINKISSIISNDFSVNIKSLNFVSEKDLFNIDTVLHIKENGALENNKKMKKIIEELEKIKNIESIVLI